MMKFEDWWATLSPPERKVLGESNARFVWSEAVEICAKVMDEMAARDRLSNYYKVAANALRSKGQ